MKNSIKKIREAVAEKVPCPHCGDKELGWQDGLKLVCAHCGDLTPKQEKAAA